MNKSSAYIAKWCTIVFILSISACNKDIVEDNLQSYIPFNLDQNGGNWKTYILVRPDEINLTAPLSSGHVSHQKELDSLKTFYSKTTQEQKENIDYWGAGAVLRWNEIARELAAKYNLAPAANAAGIYPVPNAADPLAEPKFPFANPPYVSRALAYLSVAQYDALVATWHFKYKYNRVSPAAEDAALKSIWSATGLPSYPSEGAVVAAASFSILTTIFPGEKPFLESKLKECNQSQLYALACFPEDVQAGSNLGNAIALKILARAKGDGMATANNQALTPELIQAAKNRGIQEPWISQESPSRPPMLPTFGNVLTWNLDKTTLNGIRPTLPFVIGSNEFNQELEELKTIQKKQTRSQQRIANYWADGAGSYTPPGHWHRIASDAAYANKYSEIRMARTFALVGTALMDAGIACWDTKYYYYSPRPQQYGLKTSVGLPNFPSYTSGHSTFSAASAEVLSYIFPDRSGLFQDYAKEASDSRVFGLIHFRVDCEMGLIHGKKIGTYAVQRGKNDGSGL